ncbi:MAG: hypothetical protein HYZ15_11490 [Sphingobacteriales bacterium]|nr:hypothetical protein [Sphingobacteriales bacterium]
MKRTFKWAALALGMVLGSSVFQSVLAQGDDYDRDREVSYQDFYDQLSPYGRWVDNPDYGYVWIPDAGPDFRPYSTEGHWVWTEDAEWMWVSDYDWGWAPFHYGRWDQDPYYGWFWVPGYDWSPAWVAWRDGGDYYGWAPIRPGINININFNMGSYAPPYDFWCFTPRRYILYPRVRDYCVDYRRNSSIFRVTTVINFNIGGRWGYRSGPRRYEAERYCGRITAVRFRDSYSPGRTYFRDNEVRMYRPNVRREEGRDFAPRHFERYDRNNGFRGNRGNNGNGFGRSESGNRGNNGFGRNENGNPNTRRGFENRGGRPDNRDRMDNRVIRRDDNGNQQPQGNRNNNQPDRRRFDRNDNNGGNGNRGYSPRNGNEQPRRDMNNGGNRNNDNRHFERRNDNGGGINNPAGRRTEMGGGNRPQRQAPQLERRAPAEPRQFERRQERSGNNDRGFRPQQGGNERGSGNGRRRF